MFVYNLVPETGSAILDKTKVIEINHLFSYTQINENTSSAKAWL